MPPRPLMCSTCAMLSLLYIFILLHTTTLTISSCTASSAANWPTFFNKDIHNISFVIVLDRKLRWSLGSWTWGKVVTILSQPPSSAKQSRTRSALPSIAPPVNSLAMEEVKLLHSLTCLLIQLSHKLIVPLSAVIGKVLLVKDVYITKSSAARCTSASMPVKVVKVKIWVVFDSITKSSTSRTILSTSKLP